MRPELVGSEVKVNGFVHAIRAMGDVVFVVLRKRGGLLQCVFEEGVSELSAKQVRESQTVELSGRLELDERAPHGIEIRVTGGRILSAPYAALQSLIIAAFPCVI